MELEITEITSVDGYLDSMAMCEDWMAYRLARVYISICNDAKIDPTLHGVYKYVNKHDSRGYLKT